MKKFWLFIVSILLVVPFSVSAERINTIPVSYENLKAAVIPSYINYIYIKTKNDGSVSEAIVRPVSSRNIQNAKLNGENASFVVLQRRYYATRRLFVYVIE